jgi:hypothetical protein
MISTTPSTAQTVKIFAKAASVRIDPTCNAFLNGCFRPFGIHIVPVPGDPTTTLHRQKFEACVLRLYDPEAEKILNAVRNSASNRPMVLYGIARNTKEALRCCSYGINAILDEPLDRADVVKVVRSTQRLVINELRRYARVPVQSHAVVETPAGSATATTLDVSAGGLSLRSAAVLASGAVRLMLALPHLPRLTLRAFICWQRPGIEKVYGMRFDPNDPARFRIRGWIDQHLEIV